MWAHVSHSVPVEVTGQTEGVGSRLLLDWSQIKLSPQQVPLPTEHLTGYKELSEIYYSDSQIGIDHV